MPFGIQEFINRIRLQFAYACTCVAGHIGVYEAMLLPSFWIWFSTCRTPGLELEYCGVVGGRHVFFGGEQVFAHHRVGLGRRTARLNGRKCLLGLRGLLGLLAALLAAHRRQLPGQDLVDGA